MSLFTHAKASRAAAKVAEELIYEQVAAEVAAGAIRQGLWAKAISESGGNEAAAKARYLKLRVELLIAEADLTEHAVKQATKGAAAREAREAREAEDAAKAKRFEREVADREETKESDVLAYSLLTSVILLVIISGALGLWGDLY